MAGDNGLYPYEPNQGATIAFLIAFGVSAAFHLYQMIRGKEWFYTSFVVGAFMMTIGYGARYVSAKSPADLGPYIGQSLFIILPPSLYAATIYMIFGRLVLFVDAAEASIIRPTRVTKIFVCGDVLGFLLQSSGGGMMAMESMADMGQKIMLIGLFVQLLFFGFFLFISIVFYIRLRNTSAALKVPQYSRFGWTALLKLMYCAAVVIIVRCIFRIVEFAQGHSGYLASHEAYMYILDTLPMFGVQVMFHFIRANSVFGRGRLEKLQNGDDSAINLRERYGV